MGFAAFRLTLECRWKNPNPRKTASKKICYVVKLQSAVFRPLFEPR